MIVKGHHTIILDAYNANPTSMEAALRNLKAQTSKRHIAFLGDMFEVGAQTEEAHIAIAKLAIELEIDRIYLIGQHFDQISITDNRLQTYESYAQFAQNFEGNLPQSCTILIKGSRGMAMERILAHIP